MSKRESILSVCALLAASACTNLGTSTTPNSARAPTTAWESSTLYARDGTAVAAAVQSPAGEAAPRELAPSESGRMYILELYQKAIDERDGLQREVTALGGDFESSKAQLIAAQKQLVELQARVAQLELDNQRRVDENIDLAGRLVTAQIRRLQVEKILLEQRIGQQAEATSPIETAKKP